MSKPNPSTNRKEDGRWWRWDGATRGWVEDTKALSATQPTKEL